MKSREDLPKEIAVLMGGPGSERDVSLATGRGVSKALRSLGVKVAEIDVRDKDFQLPNDVDLAFNTIHGTFGEDGQLQKILERRGVAYTGDGVSASEIAFDKIRKGGFYDFNNKYPFLNPQAGGGAEHVCPANIDAGKTKEIQELALRAFRSAGLQVYARVDAILSDNGQPYILEINTIPGMTEASLLPEAAAAADIGYADLCARIIALSQLRQRYGEQARARTEGK